MRVLLSTYGSRGDVETLAGLAVRLRALGPDTPIGAADEGPTPTTESLSAALEIALVPETGARAAAVAGTIRTDGATVAATLLLDALTREKPPVSA
ncbi:hypothetical protein [Nocardia sp. NBC_01730]|uniref:hypothetical protein n=1 Tax=Nocardia sp. NBC_01730 TaxID=2975998 RepID=UPI003FA3AE3C